ncbi:MAG: prephenate dehydratase [Candidatus Omnitrophica bacterium]|nr:prephenate dehydratase [Candidatus Omnitrophota bacterium]MDD5429203.1 prephenate dehydratase [Candidatus Omnitrophota bacterium]
MMDLKKLRNKIDFIDSKILKLLSSRMSEVKKVSRLKKEKRLKNYSPEREASMLAHLKAIGKGSLSGIDIENIFREILSACRSQDSSLKIAYFGPQGTFTHLAALKNFGKKSEYIPVDSIGDVFDKVERKEADYGVVPIENSTEGVVNYTLDMFFASNLNICSEVTLNVSHSLLAVKGVSLKKIKRVYSHPQVFPQCRRWISRSLKEAELITVSSTALAAKKAKGDRNGACIGNKVLASLYGLQVLASSMEDSLNNYTRFLIIAESDSAASGKDKTSLLFSVKDKVGALYDVLSLFKNQGINLTKIESRPSKKKPWEYYFFVDIEGHRSNPSVQKALTKLEKDCVFVKILGSYPRER